MTLGCCGRVMRGVVPLVAWAALVTLWGGCGGSPKKPAATQVAQALIRHEFVMPALGGDFRVVVFCPDAEATYRAEQAAFARLAELERVFDDTTPGSEISQLHENAGLGRVQVSDDLFFLLKEGTRLTKQSDGALDITAGPYEQLWNATIQNVRTLTEQDLAAADPLVGIDKLRLDAIGRTAHLTTAGMRLEVGALARGLACDRMLRSLNRAGFPVALVDAGGCIALGDPPPGAPGWRIEVSNAPPTADTRIVHLARRAIASSGRVGDVVVIDGRTYSRLLNPQTGIGATNLSAATVVARRAWQAAALARAAAVLGEDAGRQLVASVRNARVSFHAPPGTRAAQSESSSDSSDSAPASTDDDRGSRAAKPTSLQTPRTAPAPPTDHAKPPTARDASADHADSNPSARQRT